MKLFGFYITRTDWEYNYMMVQNIIDCLKYGLEKAQRNDMPRDSKGRFVSKQNIMTEKLRQEVYGDEQPTDNCCVGNYDEIKKASKICS